MSSNFWRAKFPMSLTSLKGSFRMITIIIIKMVFVVQDISTSILITDMIYKLTEMTIQFEDADGKSYTHKYRRTRS